MKHQSVRLIFPPQFEPFQPYLSLPYLKGYLTNNKIECKCFDANIDFYWWLFKEKRTDHTLISDREKYLDSSIDTATKIFTSEPTDLATYRWAVNVADEYLSAVSPSGIKVGLNSLSIENKYSSNDLFHYLNNSDNIFRRYFNYAKKKILEKESSQTYLFSLVVLDQLGAALSFAQEIKRYDAKARIIFGGPFISRFHNKLANIPWLSKIVDIFAPGEAYKSLPALFGFKDLLNDHVTPDFSDLDLRSYLSPDPVLPYLVSHGCSWGQCVFCTHHLSYSEYRTADLEKVVDDLSKLTEKYGVEYISFCDEYLTTSQLQKLANLINHKRIDVKWSSFVKAEPSFSDNQFTSDLYKAGARLLMFGFESASQNVLKMMKKGTNSTFYAPILTSCRNSNIAVRLDFMIGFPGETSKDIQKTFSFIKKNTNIIDTPFSSYVTAVFELREDTPLMRELSKYGIKSKALLRGDLDEQYNFINSSGVTPRQMLNWRQKIIGYAKNTLNFEVITPQNKTHQLLFKDMYDQGKMLLPIVNLSFDNFRNLAAKWHRGVILLEENKNFIRVINYSTGGELKITFSLYALLESLNKGIDLNSAYLLCKNQGVGVSIYTKLINFLYRNDYIIIKPHGCPVKVD